jgi:hypothetical protein
MRRPIENNASPGQAVYEPFSGSGTTINAAEMADRVCHAIEMPGLCRCWRGPKVGPIPTMRPAARSLIEVVRLAVYLPRNARALMGAGRGAAGEGDAGGVRSIFAGY